MNLESITKEWKCIGVIVATAVALCGTAVGFDSRYAKSVDLKQLQISANYNNFQMRLDSLRATCESTRCTAETLRTIKWLEKQIKILEQQMDTNN